MLIPFAICLRSQCRYDTIRSRIAATHGRFNRIRRAAPTCI